MKHRMGRHELHRRSVLLLILFVGLLPPWTTPAQANALPGVRGTLYESPTYGWILTAPEPDWRIVDAGSAGGVDTVHLVSDAGDGADEFFVSQLDDGRRSTGCVRGLVDSLGVAYPDNPLQGWHEPDVEFNNFAPDEDSALARVVSDSDPEQDILAYISCRRGDDGLLIGELLLRTARDLDAMEIALPLVAPHWPGDAHTGRPRADAPSPSNGEQGVVRFLARGFPSVDSGYPFPFSCIDQETFTRPAELPPPDRGWFACDGQIANIDIVPATIDLSRILLGCANPPPGEIPPECPANPVPPSHIEVMSGPPGAVTPLISLEPGASVEVVLWYALPGGNPPLDILYAEPGRVVRVGSTFFTEGTGGRIPVRVGR